MIPFTAKIQPRGATDAEYLRSLVQQLQYQNKELEIKFNEIAEVIGSLQRKSEGRKE